MAEYLVYIVGPGPAQLVAQVAGHLALLSAVRGMIRRSVDVSLRVYRRCPGSSQWVASADAPLSQWSAQLGTYVSQGVFSLAGQSAIWGSPCVQIQQSNGGIGVWQAPVFGYLP